MVSIGVKYILSDVTRTVRVRVNIPDDHRSDPMPPTTRSDLCEFNQLLNASVRVWHSILLEIYREN